MSTIASHSQLNISETVRVYRLGTNEPPIGDDLGYVYQMVKWSMTSRDPERSNSWP